jgi:putative Ca2+/H+ antiporter (TMEM165/GDT1 family)
MNLQLFASTFALIFVSELPDKTAFAALFLATHHNPLAVFTGAAAAFIIQSFVAVAFGRILGLLSPHIVHTTAGILFLVFAFLMWRRKDSSVEEPAGNHQEQVVCFRKTTLSSFLVIFAAEWGDLTQLATATLAAKYQAPLTIFTSATLALWAVTIIGVTVGCRAKQIVRPKILQRMATLAFTVAGFLLIASH